ncbi:hypothetical protein [Amycolatopsis sp. lyj-84]|uniref:hypothetical protein n=1 Tax=Amycolatopsis sp. lyj-84 TaxID=2789284 RepID=UPI00397E771F
MKVALQPAALNDREVARHYRDTIDTRVRLADHKDVFEPQTLEALMAIYPQGTAQFWGATPAANGANVGKWAKLAPGDAVFFYGQKKIYLAGHIALPFRNAVLADRLWGRNADGLTWELMFALVNLRDVALPIEEIRLALDWSDRAFIQGFTVADGEQAENLADLINLADTSNVLSLCATHARKTGSPVAPDGPTDGTRTTSWRREHPSLKRRLVELAGDTCGLCGESFPASFLVGAHIKKRAHCTEEERKDFDNIGMLACVLGCDSLFERGYISVGEDGTIIVSNIVTASARVMNFIRDHLNGRASTWWNRERDKYYAWHRQHVFITTHDGDTPRKLSMTQVTTNPNHRPDRQF